jgi:AcrR family transcriptional regulator
MISNVSPERTSPSPGEEASPPTQPGRRERERQMRRMEILGAARRVFAERGYEHATLEEIAGGAEFAKGSLYNYFSSKDELFREVVYSSIDDVEQLAASALAAGGHAREVLTRYATSVIEYYKEHDDLLRIMAVEMNRIHTGDRRVQVEDLMQRVNRIVSILASALRKDIRQKRILHENPDDLAHIFISTVHNRAMRWLFNGRDMRTLDAQQEAAFAARLFFDGAVPRPAYGGTLE